MNRVLSIMFLGLMAGIISAGEIIDPVSSARIFSMEPRTASLAGAGVALADPAGGMVINPALPHAWHRATEFPVHTGVTYGRGGLFSSHQFSTIASAQVSPELTIGSRYLYCKSTDGGVVNQTTISTSGTMFNKSGTQGGVDIGANLHYLSVKWPLSPESTIVRTHRIGSDGLPGSNPIDTSFYSTTSPRTASPTELEDKRVVLDIGFYQYDLAPNLDFGLVFKDVIGYAWSTNRTGLHRTISDTVMPTVYTSPGFYIDSIQTTSFSGSQKHTGFVSGDDRSMVVGLTLHHPFKDGKINLAIPADLTFIDLFDGHKGLVLGLRVGAEILIFERIALRGGFSRMPDELYIGKDAPLVNSFSGGGGIYLPQAAIDVAIMKDRFSIAVRGFFGGKTKDDDD